MKLSTPLLSLFVSIGYVASASLQVTELTNLPDDPAIIFNGAFYDPRYHDDGRDPDQGNEVATKDSPAEPSENSEPAVVKFKRGIANSVDFSVFGDGDSLAMESHSEPQRILSASIGDSVAMESHSEPQKARTASPVVMKVKLVEANSKTKEAKASKSTPKKKEKDSKASGSEDQVKTETTPVKNEIPEEVIDIHHYFYNEPYGYNPTQYLYHAKDNVFHGRRKMRAHYYRPHRTPSLGKVWLQMHSQIGYW